MRIFITGTDTNVGKTVVSALICARSKMSYWKPIQTGDDSDSQMVKQLTPDSEIIPEIYKLKHPLSAYDAANLEGIKIDVNKFTAAAQSLPQDVVIEGAGGVMVPIAEDFLMVDLIDVLNASAIVVAKSQLGFLNHIFLTVEALKARGISIIGIVVNGSTEKFLIDTIESFTKIKVLKVIPPYDNVQTLVHNEVLDLNWNF